MEFVHDDGRDLREVESLRAERHFLGQIRLAVGVQQAVEQNLGDDDEDAGVGVDAAVAGDEAHVVGPKAPTHGRRLHFLKFLFGQRDQGRRVISDRAGVQRLEEGGLGDERLAGAGGAQTKTPCSAVNQASRASSCTG